jgi:hypothetical protein
MFSIKKIMSNPRSRSGISTITSNLTLLGSWLSMVSPASFGPDSIFPGNGAGVCLLQNAKVRER